MIDINEIKAHRVTKLERLIYDVLSNVYRVDGGFYFDYKVGDDRCFMVNKHTNNLVISSNTIKKHIGHLSLLEIKEMSEIITPICRKIHDNYNQ